MKSSKKDSFKICLIALGSNLENPKEQVKDAMRILERLGQIEARSSLYSSPALAEGPLNQADYINAVVKLRTELDPKGLLDALKRIENEQGRIEIEKWGPRILDLDIISFGDQVISISGLTIPHGETMNRPFVLKPLLDVAPDWIHPQTGISASNALSQLGSYTLRKLD